MKFIVLLVSFVFYFFIGSLGYFPNYLYPMFPGLGAGGTFWQQSRILQTAFTTSSKGLGFNDIPMNYFVIRSKFNDR